MRSRWPKGGLLLVVAFVLFSILGADLASAVPPAVTATASGGGGTMLTDLQTGTLDMKAGVEARLSFRAQPFGALTLGIAGGLTIFPSKRGPGQVIDLQAVVGWDDARVASRPFVLAAAGLAQTGGLSRFGWRVSAGWRFPLSKRLGLSPFVVYVEVDPTDRDLPNPARYLLGGVRLDYLIVRPAKDSDGDGIFDENDICPNEIPGVHPDSERLGCPIADQDGDGFADRDDLCPREAPGETPDPDRKGCPLKDGDGDGVADSRDLCPTVVVGATPDPDRAGCPAPDADEDGVIDREDVCPTLAAGETPDPDRVGCPDGDDDNDGLRNQLDRCPTVHQGPYPDPARTGCPLNDRDHDSIPDLKDACPDQPGSPHPNPRRNGCAGLVRVDAEQIRIMKPVFFASNKERILGKSKPVLKAVADALKASPYIRKVRIGGHTDDVGGAGRNLKLSERRARTVMKALIRLGIDPERLSAKGFGKSEPLALGRSRKARAMNRRVEFRIIDPDLSGGVLEQEGSGP